MTKFSWCEIKDGYTLYCYIQYNVYSFFYCLSILTVTCVILCGSSRAYASMASHDQFIFSLCSVSDIDEGLEVRDIQGRIVQKASAHKQLQNLFVSHLTALLYKADIYSIAESQASLRKSLHFAERMIALPVNAIMFFSCAVIMPSVKKYFFSQRYMRRTVNPDITILIFPAFLFAAFSKKLSTVILRL